ncbi:MAG: TlpA family protein disulfide reductase [Bacteroidetes bacterium]|nr:TlpA family protein disulfide reductase [Bacteroidota bacterium]
MKKLIKFLAHWKGWLLPTFPFMNWFLFTMSVFGQSPGRHFVLNGKINIDMGRAYLVPVSYDSSYYPTEAVFHKTMISKGKFTIRGLCSQPSMFGLCIAADSVPIYISNYFIVNSGIQDITCNIDSIREIPGIGNKYMGEFRNFETAQEKRETERSQFLLNYARAHRESFIVLWEMIEKLTGGGYDPLLDSAYHSLSVPVRSSFAGKVLAKKMATMRRFGVGAPFPELALLDTNLNKVKIDLFSRHSKYALVDFWYSHCGPCLREFEELKKLYKENEPFGLAVAAVSTDDKKSVQDWKRVIREYRLPWPQYLDMGGHQASGLLIRAFPTTFLLDSQGKIVKRDPDLKSLSLFLEEHIH